MSVASTEADAESITSSDFFEDPLLETDLYQIDDAEFGIPELDSIPSLDDALAEPSDDFSPIASSDSTISVHSGNLITKRRLGLNQSPFGSVESLQLISGTKPDPRAKASILRHVKLKCISVNIVSARTRRNAGFPTCIASGTTIAVGTSHGYLLIFTSKQLLRFFLEPSESCGSVSALCYNNDSSRLLAGHERGVVNMWDANTGKILRVINDCPGSAVLHVKFTDDHTKAFMSNGTGSVFFMSFKRPMGMRVCDSKLIFSGSRGEVLAVEPLLVSGRVSNHALNEFNPIYVAMATFSKMFIIRMSPKTIVIFTYPLKGDVSTLPIISWQFIKLQINKDSPTAIDPIILFGRDSRILFGLLSPSKNAKDDTVRIVKTLNFSYSIINFSWLNNKTIVIVDQKEYLHVVDIQTEQNAESLDLQHVGLVYATSQFKGLANEIGVSPALIAASTYPCYYSMLVSSGQLLILGQESLHVFVIRTWQERVDILRKEKLYFDAISLGREIYDNRARAISGALGPKKRYLVDAIMSIVVEYSHSIIQNAPCREEVEISDQRNSIDLLSAYFSELVPFVIDTCCLMKQQELLFGEVYSIIHVDSIAQCIFLNEIQQFVLSGSITSIAPTVLKDLINYDIESDNIPIIQDLILKLDYSSIDIDQVVRLSWKNRLYDAIIYLYNRALGNYMIPLEEMVERLRSENSNETQRQLVNKILVYLSCCLTGRDYTYGNIKEEMQKNVKIQALKFLLQDAQPPQPRFPNSNLLLRLDTREFLNVLAISFEEQEFSTIEGLRVRQRIIDMVMQIATHSQSNFSASQLGSIYIFLAHQLIRASLSLDSEVFDQIVSYLTSPDPELRSTSVERERVVMELLLAQVIPLDDPSLEERLLGVQFFSVLEYVYEKRGEFHKMLRCYCMDESRTKMVFRFIRAVLYQFDVTSEQRKQFVDEVNRNLDTLIIVDPSKAAQLLLIEMGVSVDRVMAQLSIDHDSSMVYQFLSGAVELKSREKSKDKFQLSRTVVKHYMKLAACLVPSALEHFIRKSDIYQIEDAMEVCKANNLGGCVALVHVRCGNYSQAARVYVDYVDSLISAFLNLDAESEVRAGAAAVDHETVELQVGKCAELLRDMVSVHRLPQKECQDAWFRLLDAVVAPLKCHVEDSGGRFKHLLFSLLNSMIGYISLPVMLNKVFNDPAYGSSKYEDVKDLINGMFDTCNYELTLLTITSRLIDQDTFWNFAKLSRSLARGVRPLHAQCFTCYRKLSRPHQSNQQLVLFHCGHGYHQNCLNKAQYFTVDANNDLLYVCVVCKKRADPNYVFNQPNVHIADIPSGKTRSHTVDQAEGNMDVLRRHRRDAQNRRLSLSATLEGESFDSLQSDSFKLNMRPRTNRRTIFE